MHLDQGKGQRQLSLQAQPTRARGLAGNVVSHAGVRLAQQRDHAVQQDVCIAPLCVPHLHRTSTTCRRLAHDQQPTYGHLLEKMP